MSRPVIDGVYLDETLTHAEMIALAEAFGGTRLYVPKQMTTKHRIAREIGFDGAKRLWDAFGEGMLTIPLLRDERAVFYRSNGLSFAQIARKLGLTEKGVAVMFKRLRDAGQSGRNSLV